MRELFLAWVEFISGRAKTIKGIDVDLFGWCSTENNGTIENFKVETADSPSVNYAAVVQLLGASLRNNANK